MEINCLSYALRFWNEHPDYKIWYNSGHCINVPSYVSLAFYGKHKFLPIEEFGFLYFERAFKDLISREDKELLKKYFNK
jgi:hypothetical protein